MSNQDVLGVYSRRTGESQKAFAAYCEYRDMGVQRSLEAVHRKLAKSSRLLKRWSSQWEWVKRAAAYDADLAEKERAAKEYALKAEAAKWAERRFAVKEEEFATGGAMLEKAKEIMRFPLQQVEHKEVEELPDGKTLVKVTVIQPMKNVGPRDAAILGKTGAELQRNAAEMPTVRTVVQGTGEGGAILVEDMEEVRKKRWLEAAPAFMAMLKEELGVVGDSLDTSIQES